MVKMFGWEARMSERIDAKREDELKLLRKYQLINVSVTILKYVAILSVLCFQLIILCSRLIPMLSMVVTFLIYVRITNKRLGLPIDILRSLW